MKPATLSLLCLAALVAACGSKPSSQTDAGTGVDAGTGSGEDAGMDAGYPDPFTITAFDNARITSIGSEPNFQKVETEIDWGTSSKAAVMLVVDLHSTCYPFESWEQNRPPTGQNWPADCDAFDRNFEFILDPAASGDAKPGVELVRAITPFGGPEHLEIDITDIANGLPGKHTLRSTIPTWSDSAGQVSGSAGGWNVSAQIVVVPGPAPHKVLAVLPLFDGNVNTTGDGPQIAFSLPEGTKSADLQYRVTGHGGDSTADSQCIGPAEEFCRRQHTLKADGAQLDQFTPWRSNCSDNCTVEHYTPPGGGAGFDYCLENPCGNMGSVRAPRANWCPGTMTPPIEYQPTQWTTPGQHSFQWNISKVAASGTWRLSAVVVAYGD